MENYQRLWNDVANSPDEDGAVPILGEILADGEGRDFISRFGPKQADICTKILDHVSCELRLLPFHCFS